MCVLLLSISGTFWFREPSIPICCHRKQQEAADAEAIWKSEITRDPVSLDAGRGRPTLSTRRQEPPRGRSAKRGLSAIEPQCPDPDAGRWRCGAVGIDGH